MLSSRNLKLKGKTFTFKPKYVGPFPILRMVGDNVCELELPESMIIHPVGNVSQVKKYHSSFQRLPPIEIDGEEEYEVEGILDHRRSGRGYQYLIFGQVMMPPRTSSYPIKSCRTVMSC